MMHHYYSSDGGDNVEQREQQRLASEERDWAWKARTGDQDAFASLVQIYQDALFDYIYHLLQDSEWAADILQNVFLRLYLSLPQLTLEKPIKPWLFQVAHNCCMDAFRERRRYRWKPFSDLEQEDQFHDDLLALEDPSVNVEDLCEYHDLQACLQQAILALPIRSRSVVLLRYTSNLTFAGIGAALDIREQTARIYFCRAKKALRQRLAHEGITSAW